MTLALALTLVALGFAGSFVSGLLGVGGAILMIPLLLYVPPLLGVGQLDMKAVAALSITQVFFAATVGAIVHRGRGAVHRDLVIVAGGAIALGAFAGGAGSKFVEARALLAVFSAMAALGVVLMVLPIAEHVADVGKPGRLRFNRPTAFAAALVVGILSGLVGAGGGFLLMPVLIGLIRVPIRIAIGSSLAITALSGLAGLIGKVVTGQLWFGAAALLVAGGIVGAQVGSRLSHRVHAQVLRWLLAALIALVALRTAWDVFH
ncbi:MAG: sulfite exporter TauE/SafE family protein [Chloroflexi bacterium]|nr:sulfite exporter TauE/SafE family protein [Chloroflexota bacterium]